MVQSRRSQLTSISVARGMVSGISQRLLMATWRQTGIAINARAVQIKILCRRRLIAPDKPMAPIAVRAVATVRDSGRNQC